MNIKDKYRGCLIGGASGDALGYEIEFEQEDYIFEKYGKNGITEYELHDNKALISDDTQMTMFTVTALLDAKTICVAKKRKNTYIDFLKKMIGKEYRAWLTTQIPEYKTDFIRSWIMNYPEIFQERMPGTTCLTSLMSNVDGSVEERFNDSKGCGGVMRVAPIGLYAANDNLSDKDTCLLGAESAAITHGHDLGILPSAVLAETIKLLIETDKNIRTAVTDAMKYTYNLYSGFKSIQELSIIIDVALSFAESDMNDLEAIHQLGEGWTGEQALAIAVYCAVKYQDNFEKAICTAVNHNGDSDSTGAICGNIIGTYLGYSKIPQKYKENLELKDIILELADDLYLGCYEKKIDLTDKKWIQKYIEKSYIIE